MEDNKKKALEQIINDIPSQDNDLDSLQKMRRNERQIDRLKGSDKSLNLAKGSLDQDILKVSGGSVGRDVTPDVTKIKGTDVIDTIEEAPIKSGKQFGKEMAERSLKSDLKSTFADAVKRGDTEMMDKLRQIAARMGKAGSAGLKSIPLVGGIAAAALGGAEDASAAIPILDSAESVGMSPSEEDQMIAETKARQDYEQSPAKRDALRKLMELKNGR